MLNINEVVLAGFLGYDPHMKFQGQEPVCRLSLATNKIMPRGSVQTPDWHEVIVKGKLADYAVKNCKKGSHVYLKGYLEAIRHPTEKGIFRVSYEIHATEFQLIGKKEAANTEANTTQAGGVIQPVAAKSKAKGAQMHADPAFNGDDPAL